jgi:hypothetical protein
MRQRKNLDSGMADNTKPCVQKAERRLPLAVPVHVQCDGFRCLAYRDKNGQWINYHNDEPLTGEVRVVEYKSS